MASEQAPVATAEDVARNLRQLREEQARIQRLIDLAEREQVEPGDAEPAADHAGAVAGMESKGERRAQPPAQPSISDGDREREDAGEEKTPGVVKLEKKKKKKKLKTEQTATGGGGGGGVVKLEKKKTKKDNKKLRKKPQSKKPAADKNNSEPARVELRGPALAVGTHAEHPTFLEPERRILDEKPTLVPSSSGDFGTQLDGAEEVGENIFFSFQAGQGELNEEQVEAVWANYRKGDGNVLLPDETQRLLSHFVEAVWRWMRDIHAMGLPELGPRRLELFETKFKALDHSALAHFLHKLLDVDEDGQVTRRDFIEGFNVAVRVLMEKKLPSVVPSNMSAAAASNDKDGGQKKKKKKKKRHQRRRRREEERERLGLTEDEKYEASLPAHAKMGSVVNPVLDLPRRDNRRRHVPKELRDQVVEAVDYRAEIERAMEVEKEKRSGKRFLSGWFNRRSKEDKPVPETRKEAAAVYYE